MDQKTPSHSTPHIPKLSSRFETTGLPSQGVPCAFYILAHAIYKIIDWTERTQPTALIDRIKTPQLYQPRRGIETF